MENFITIKGFHLENQEKLDRVVFGDMGRAGVLEGGLGEDAEPELVLAHYDKIGGYITKGGVKIKNGSFWDSKKKAPRTEDEVMYLFNIGGDTVEVDDPKNLAEAISVVEKTRSEKEAKVKEKKAKSKFKQS
jgi:hypothetical protein